MWQPLLVSSRRHAPQSAYWPVCTPYLSGMQFQTRRRRGCGAALLCHASPLAEPVGARLPLRLSVFHSRWCSSSGCSTTCAQLCARDNPHSVLSSVPLAQASSEELRLGAVSALAALVENSCVDELLAEANAPRLGHALSLLLQVADSEASAGDRGSRTLRAEAFRTLELLLRQARTHVEHVAP